MSVGRKARTVDWSLLDGLVDQGLNCKEIAKYYKYSHSVFGLKAKEYLGIYLSQYITQRNNPTSVIKW